MSDQSGDRWTSEASRFRASIDQLSVRSAQALRLWLVQGVNRTGCAGLFGITQSSFDVMFLRAARELRARLAPGGEAVLPGSYRSEVEQANLLAEALEHELALSGELGALLALVRQVRSLAGEIQAHDRAALLQEQSSPRYRRRRLIWRALLLAIVGASLLLYLRPRAPARIISRVPQEELR